MATSKPLRILVAVDDPPAARAAIAAVVEFPWPDATHVRAVVALRQGYFGLRCKVLDDILDEGHTLSAIRDRLLQQGATAFYSAVFADKAIGRKKPIEADFVGVTVPNRYVFGFGMDVEGAWRNLPAIYAVKE